MRALIGIAGRKRSGKDTLADYLVGAYGYRKRAFADPLRVMALAIDPIVRVTSDEIGHDVQRLSSVVAGRGWERAKEEVPEVRRFLQRLGTDGVRGTFGPNAWTDLALGGGAPAERTVFVDCRFPSEVEAVVQAGGQVIRVVRPSLPTEDLHPSETALDDVDLPTVVNDGPKAWLWRRADLLLGAPRQVVASIGCAICGSYDHVTHSQFDD